MDKLNLAFAGYSSIHLFCYRAALKETDIDNSRLRNHFYLINTFSSETKMDVYYLEDCLCEEKGDELTQLDPNAEFPCEQHDIMIVHPYESGAHIKWWYDVITKNPAIIFYFWKTQESGLGYLKLLSQVVKQAGFSDRALFRRRYPTTIDDLIKLKALQNQ